MVLDLDLNNLPAESSEFDYDAALIGQQHEQISLFVSPGSVASPIDADAFDDDDDDDDVILLPSSAWFPSLAKSQSRRKRPLTEINALQSEVVEEPVTTLSLGNGIQKPRIKITLERTVIDCDLNAKEKCVPKKNKGKKPNPVTFKEASEPVFEDKSSLTCPVCLSSLNVPWTTVCGHLFCHTCIETAISKQKKCPTCRTKLTKRNFHRIFLT